MRDVLFTTVIWNLSIIPHFLPEYGDQVAFSWSGEKRDNEGYLRQVGGRRSSTAPHKRPAIGSEIQPGHPTAVPLLSFEINRKTEQLLITIPALGGTGKKTDR